MQTPYCKKFAVFRSSHEAMTRQQINLSFKDKITVKRLAVLKCDTNGYQKIITGQDTCLSGLTKEIAV